MAYRNYHKRTIADRDLHPETQMVSYGYDPFLSEGSVKPPVFLTSTFAFRTAEDRWSIAECLEHVIRVESRICGLVGNALRDGAPQPEKLRPAPCPFRPLASPDREKRGRLPNPNSSGP